VTKLYATHHLAKAQPQECVLTYFFGLKSEHLGVDLVDLNTFFQLFLELSGVLFLLLLSLGLLLLFLLDLDLIGRHSKLLFFDGLTFGGSELSGLHVGDVLQELLTSLVGVVEFLLVTTGIAGARQLLSLFVHLNGELGVLAFTAEDVFGYKPSLVVKY
jgi:hypothetical protein